MDEDLIKFIKFIGSVVFTAMMYAFPILLACSFAFSWIPFIKLVLLIANLLMFTVICAAVFDEVDD